MSFCIRAASACSHLVTEAVPNLLVAIVCLIFTEAMAGCAAYAEAQERCSTYVAESGALLIHPYDAAETVAGQGTVALEWDEDLDNGFRPAGLIDMSRAYHASQVRIIRSVNPARVACCRLNAPN